VTSRPTEPATHQPGNPLASPELGKAVADHIGGVRGLIESTVPIAVFVIVNIIASLQVALWAAVGTAGAIALVRLVRRQSIRQALNGVIGVAFAALIAARTGNAEDFYLPGIILNFVYGTAFAASVALRRPLIGYIWTFVTGEHPEWRRTTALLRVFGLLTLVWAGIFYLRGAAQLVLYLLEMPNALGVVRIAGTGLYLGAFVFTVWYGRRRLQPLAGAGAPA
jgi:hypothetical protein